MRVGRYAEEVVPRAYERREVILPGISQRPGKQDPRVEEHVLDGIVFIFIPER
jgi:hypothetical protein